MNKRTNEEILKRAIERAKANGWTMWGLKGVIWDTINEKRMSGKRVRFFGIGFFGAGYFGLNDIIFSHDFAKAFWGEGEEYAPLPEWMYQLQQMVIHDDPIRYLEQFLDREEVTAHER